MSNPSPAKLAEWKARAALKDAIVPDFFEVFPNKVIIHCGRCRTKYQRTLIPNVNEPTFVCPNEPCRAKNWVPVTFKKG